MGWPCLSGGATVSRTFPNLAFHECPDEREDLILLWRHVYALRFDAQNDPRVGRPAPISLAP